MIFLLFLFRFVFFAFSFRLFKFVFSIVFRVYLQARAFLSRLNILGFLIEICDSSHYSDYHNWKWVDLLKKVGKWRLKVHQYLLKILLQIEAWKKAFEIEQKRRIQMPEKNETQNEKYSAVLIPSLDLPRDPLWCRCARYRILHKTRIIACTHFSSL